MLSRSNPLRQFLCSVIMCSCNVNSADAQDYSNQHFRYKVNFIDSHFMQEARFNSVDFDSSVSFNNARFDSVVSFNGSKFHFGADFSNTTFLDTVYFKTIKDSDHTDSVKFLKTANFVGSDFRADAHFDGVSFQDVYFANSEYNSALNFFSSNFESHANFYSDTFNAPLVITCCKFKKGIDFSYSKFHSTLEIVGCTYVTIDSNGMHGTPIPTSFSGAVNFEGVQFDSLVDFGGCYFGTRVIFKHAVFNGRTVFEAVGLPDYLDFRKVVIGDHIIDLTQCRLPKLGAGKCKIALYGTDLDKIKINYELFELWFPDDFGTEWQEHTHEHRVSMYEKLLKKFKDDGFEESYKWLDIEYREYKYLYGKESTWITKFIAYPFQKYWWNYGYNREIGVLWCIFIWLYFSFFVVPFLLPYLRSEVYKIDDFPFLEEDKNKKVSFLRSRLVNSLFYTSIIFFGIKMSLNKFHKLVGHTVTVLVIYLVGLFCVAYTVNYVVFNL